MRRYVILIILLTLCIVVTIWITNTGKIGVMEPFTYGEILKEAQRHIIMVVIAEGIAIAIGVPLGILVTRPGFKWLTTPVIGGANVGQTIPSLAVIAILATLPFTFYFLDFGLNRETAIVALVIYGLLPIVRNSYAGINNIDPATVEAARGMGMTRGQIARKIELPLALPVIMTGIRVSTIVIVGTATLCALIAAGGLGRIILAGVAVSEPLIILQGAAPTAALAITLGFILERIESWMTPRGLKVKAEVS